MVNIYTNDNPVRVITSWCNTSIKKRSILVKKTLYAIADNLPSKIKDTNNSLLLFLLIILCLTILH